MNAAKDAVGRSLRVVKLRAPPKLLRAAEEVPAAELDGSIAREEGEVMPASYVNFYIANGGLVVPAFGGEAAAADAAAAQVLQQEFPRHEVVRVETRAVLVGGGNIHCITQQQPAAALAKS